MTAVVGVQWGENIPGKASEPYTASMAGELVKLPKRAAAPMPARLSHKPHPGCAAQSGARKSLSRTCSVSRPASLCRNRTRSGAALLDPATHSEKAMWAGVWGSSGEQPARWPGEGLSFCVRRFQKAVHRYPFSCEVRNWAEGLVFSSSHLEPSVSSPVSPISCFKDGGHLWQLPVPHADFRLQVKYLNK